MTVSILYSSATSTSPIVSTYRTFGFLDALLARDNRVSFNHCTWKSFLQSKRKELSVGEISEFISKTLSNQMIYQTK